MKEQVLPFLVFQGAAFLGALGQLLYKRGATARALGKTRLWSVGNILGGMTLYVVVTLLFVLAYRMGGEVSVLYPSYAATFIWGLVLARFLSDERITPVKVLGTLCVMGGICLAAL